MTTNKDNSNNNDNPDNKEFTRRPNPKGWTPPKAPYNPYDPNDTRPPGGYPSEFKLPAKNQVDFHHYLKVLPNIKKSMKPWKD